MIYLYTIIVSYITSLLLCKYLIKHPKKFQWSKRAYVERVKLHTKGVPRLGGVAIAGSFFITMLLLFIFQRGLFEGNQLRFFGIIFSAVIIVMVGAFDDLVRRLGYKIKFTLQITAALVLVVFSYNINTITNPLGGSIYIGALGVIFVIIWVLVVANAINLIDGLDGLACGIALMAVIGFFIISFTQGQSFILIITASLIGAMLAFLKYNFYPAKLFLGDSGSLFLGLMLAVVAMQSSVKRATLVSLIVPLLTLLIPVASILFTFSRRLVVAKHPFKADRMHLHYRLIRAGISHKDVVLIFYTITFSYVTLGGFCFFMPKRYEVAIIFFAAITIWAVYLWALHFLNIQKKKGKKRGKPIKI